MATDQKLDSRNLQLKKYYLYQNFIFTTGNIIEGQLYQVCIRQEVGTCSIAYTPRQGFVFLIFFQSSQILSQERSWHKNDKSKKLRNLQNFNSLMIKLTKTPILPNCQVPNGYFCICWKKYIISITGIPKFPQFRFPRFLIYCCL